MCLIQEDQLRFIQCQMSLINMIIHTLKVNKTLTLSALLYDDNKNKIIRDLDKAHIMHKKSKHYWQMTNVCLFAAVIKKTNGSDYVVLVEQHNVSLKHFCNKVCRKQNFTMTQSSDFEILWENLTFSEQFRKLINRIKELPIA